VTRLGTITDQYFEWLYSHIGAVKNRDPSKSRWSLTRVLYTTPFIWFVPNDDNRAADGIDLRLEFIHASDMDVDRDWMELECSMLEMLIALSRHASFQDGGTHADWFFKILNNLEIRDYTDDVWEISLEEEVNEALETINQRTYKRNGHGGLFPLRHARQDQRDVELWYQLAAYLLEGNTAG
jgi:hypothetical protein